MSWQRDREIQSDVNLFKSIFPEQTKSTTSIVVWSIIFLVDLILCVAGAFYFDMINIETFSKWTIIMVMGSVVIIFWIEGMLWRTITKFLNK